MSDRFLRDPLAKMGEMLGGFERRLRQLELRGAGVTVIDGGSTSTPALAPQFTYDRFPTTGTLGSTPTSLTLTYTPVAGSLHLYLNRDTILDEGTDHTWSGNTVTLLGSPAATGDFLVARYAFTDATPDTSSAYPVTPTDYPGVVLADSPDGFWRLGDASGTVMTDSSGNSHNGVYTNSPTLAATGLLVGDTDTCVTFDGSNDYAAVTYGSWMDATQVTVEAIIKTSATGTRSICDRDNASQRVFQFRMDGTKLNFIHLGGGFASATSSASINDGAPHHVAATFDGSTIKLYIDGVLDGSTSFATALPTSPADITVGVNGSGGLAQFWLGQIDEAAYYTTALTAGQIADHFTATGL